MLCEWVLYSATYMIEYNYLCTSIVVGTFHGHTLTLTITSNSMTLTKKKKLKKKKLL